MPSDADQFVAEIRVFGFNFAPAGWATCDGQLLALSQNTALFSLLGTTYGGDGKSTFALPNLQDSVPVGSGQGPGLSQRFLGEFGGEPFVTLLETEIPPHTHTVQARATAADLQAPSPTRALARSVGDTVYSDATGSANLVQMSPDSLAIAGGSLPHNNFAPSLVLNYCIAMTGIFPPRQ